MAQTLAEQILSHAAGQPARAGDNVVVNVDLVMMHDSLSPSIIRVIHDELGADKVWDTDKVAVVVDHVAPASTVQNAEHQAALRRWVRAIGAPSHRRRLALHKGAFVLRGLYARQHATTTRRSFMNINPNAPLVAHHSILIDAPRSVVWQLLTNVADWPRWQPAVTRVQIDGPFAPGTVFRWNAGTAIVSTIQDVEPQRIAWTGKAAGTTAEHVWTLEETATGTLVTTSESMSGWLIYPVKLVTPRFLSDALHTWLAALKHAAEPQPKPAGRRLEGAMQ